MEGLDLVSANSGGTADPQQRFYLGPGKFPMGLDLSVKKLRRITTIQALVWDSESPNSVGFLAERQDVHS